MIKKILAGIVVLIAAVAIYLHFNLDHIVKVAIEKYGTAAAQTEVSVGHVQLSLAAGQGVLSDLTVANPKGFSSAKALSFDSIAMSMDPGSLRGSGPIIIHQIVIDQPQVNFEGTDTGNTNLQALERNLSSSNATGGGASSQPEGPARKIIIDDLIIQNGQIAISHPLLKKPLNAELPAIHLTNIGRNRGGDTPVQVADQLLTSVVTSASRIAAEKLITAKVKNAVGSGAGGIGSKLDGLLR